MNLTKKYNLIEILPFIISFLFLAVLFYFYIKHPFISIDEGYTKGLINLSFADMISITANDVHPPVYYIITMIFTKICNAINFNFDIVRLMKFPSMIPYFIILIFSFTKIKKDYGLLAGGIFSLAMISMSEFFTFYITARMYSWGMLFLIVSVFYLKDILDNNDLKSWLLFTIFSLLCAYTHYFAAVASVMIYIMLLVWIFTKGDRNLKDDLKKFFISIIVGIVLYAPWFMPLYTQMHAVHEYYWVEPLTLNTLIQYFSYTLTISNNQIIQLVSMAIVIGTAAIFLKKYIETKNNEDLLLFMCVSTFIGTLLIGYLLSVFYKPILIGRYLLPAAGVFWLGISIKLGNLKSKNSVILIIILLIAMVGALNVYHQMDEISDSDKLPEYKILDEINNNDTIIIYDSDNHYVRTHNNFNKVYKQFDGYTLDGWSTPEMMYRNDPNVTYERFVLPDDLNKYPDKNVYMLRTMRNHQFPDYLKADLIGTAQHANIYKLEPA